MLPTKIPLLRNPKVLVEPIDIDEANLLRHYAMFDTPKDLAERIFRELETVLQIMLRKGLTLLPERKAVHFYEAVYIDEAEVMTLKAKAGTEFPTDEFGANCKIFCKEKVTRTYRCGLICSHENRNPEKSYWGGSARLVFRLISNSGEIRIITIIFAPSGLKEWEDLALGLGAFCRMGLILDGDDEQVGKILAAAEKSVAREKGCSPKGMTITDYVEKVFDAVRR